MKTICTLNGKIVMSQDGDALEAMQKNAAQYPGAVASVVTDTEYTQLIESQPKTTEEQNSIIKIQIDLLDKRRIRPLAEGDTVYLQQLNDQIKTLRAQLV